MQLTDNLVVFHSEGDEGRGQQVGEGKAKSIKFVRVEEGEDLPEGVVPLVEAFLLKSCPPLTSIPK